MMENEFPCTCGHSIEDHITRSLENDNTWSKMVAMCQHDKAYFKGMCTCSWFKQMTNLEYLEWEYEKSSKVH